MVKQLLLKIYCFSYRFNKLEITFKEAKNNSRTFLINSVYYHSAYDPQKEASRFVESINFTTPPEILYVIESGFDYCTSQLKEKFQETKIINISIIRNKEIPLKENEIFYEDFSTHLEKQESESVINSQIVCWPVAEKLFTTEISSIFNQYKKAFEFAKTVLITKQYFEKKWFKNSIYFLKSANKIASIKKINENILVIASGPSLKENLSFIKENQNKFIIFALSSAINPLLKNGITPDLCLSTDGGFWATKHLYPLVKNNIPLAVAIEGAFPKQLFNSHTLIPLVYEQGLASILYKSLNLPFVKAQSCPTVSETAIKLASEITSKSVYIAGLDLSCRKGFAHCQPNILELENSLKDNRLKPAMNRIALSEINSKSSLSAYKLSFSYGKFSNCFRIIDSQITTHLDSMTEINSLEFQNKTNGIQEIKSKNILTAETHINDKEKSTFISKINSFIEENSKTDFWNRNLYPLDYSVISHFSPSEQKEKLIEIMNKNNDYVQNLRKLINE